MAILDAQGISLYYETYGDPARSPVLLLSGLGGTGRSWHGQTDRFAKDHYVVVPDHRGTGGSSRTEEGHITTQLAADMAALVDHLAVGPMHVIGASTGGAIAQYMALNHPNTVRSLTMVASFARFDPVVEQQFVVRRTMAAEWDRRDLLTGNALFLFAPKYIREHPEQVTEWIRQTAAQPTHPLDRAIALKRIDMIAAHDTLARLGSITRPTLVVCGALDFGTSPHLLQEIAAIPGSALIVLADCGRLVEAEAPGDFFGIVSRFIVRDPVGDTLVGAGWGSVWSSRT